ncbi:MAG: thermonuclease family protein [Elusimicrobia bacterium]|jgi:endonuclease YncB( thermonuclease family)|nr:thermonuclease family protein [Elusimicrobiota bacterium]
MQKYKFTKITVLILTLLIGVMFFIINKNKENLKKPRYFTHPMFKGYELSFRKVRKVYDGDTVVLENNLEVRYLGIDTPEVAHSRNEFDEPGSVVADNVNKKLVMGKKVLLVVPKEKEYTYDQLLAYIYAPIDGEYVNVTKHLLRKDLGDSKYGKPDPDLLYKVPANIFDTFSAER